MSSDKLPLSAGAAPAMPNREGSAQASATAVEMTGVSIAKSPLRKYGSNGVNGVSEDDSPPDIVVDAEDEGETTERGFRQTLHYVFFEKEPLLCRITKWVFVTLLALFLAAVVFGVFYSGFRTTTVVNNETCDTPLGSMLGAHNGVIGFSNCNSDYVSREMYSVPLPVRAANGTLRTESVFAGMRWQCVEYARRYWMLAGSPEPAIFGDVDGAADIWDLREVTAVGDMHTTRPLYGFPNNESILSGGSMPQAGDILIYPRQLGDEFPAGHVAVIVKVEPPANKNGKVYLAEQNWDSHAWTAPFYNYSRTLPLVYNSKTLAYSITDPYGSITGWMRYG